MALSFPHAAQEDDVTISTFSQSSKYMHVRVEKPAEGYLCTLSMASRCRQLHIAVLLLPPPSTQQRSPV